MKAFNISNIFVKKIYTWEAFSKKLLNELANLDSSEIIFPYSTNGLFP